MNNFCFAQTQSTFSQLTITVSVLACISNKLTITLDKENPIFDSPYKWVGVNPTYSLEKIKIRDPFEEDLTKFYSILLENQQPLGNDFEKILYDNLWDLYQS